MTTDRDDVCTDAMLTADHYAKVDPKGGKPAPKKSAVKRTLRYDAATATLTITQTVGRKTTVTAYSVERVGSDWGDGFRLTKHVGAADDECDAYHVNLSNEGHSCDCLGALRHGHKTPCRHVAALRVLRDLGRI